MDKAGNKPVVYTESPRWAHAPCISCSWSVVWRFSFPVTEQLCLASCLHRHTCRVLLLCLKGETSRAPPLKPSKKCSVVSVRCGYSNCQGGFLEASPAILPRVRPTPVRTGACSLQRGAILGLLVQRRLSQGWFAALMSEIMKSPCGRAVSHVALCWSLSAQALSGAMTI